MSRHPVPTAQGRTSDVAVGVLYTAVVASNGRQPRLHAVADVPQGSACRVA